MVLILIVMVGCGEIKELPKEPEMTSKEMIDLGRRLDHCGSNTRTLLEEQSVRLSEHARLIRHSERMNWQVKEMTEACKNWDKGVITIKGGRKYIAIPCSNAIGYHRSVCSNGGHRYE